MEPENSRISPLQLALEERFIRDLAQDNGHILRSVFNAASAEDDQEVLGAGLARMLLRHAVAHEHNAALVGQVLALCWDYEMNRASEVNRNAHLFMRGNGVVPKIWRHVLSPEGDACQQRSSSAQDPFLELRLLVRDFLQRSLSPMVAGDERKTPVSESSAEPSTLTGLRSSLVLTEAVDLFLDGSTDNDEQLAKAADVIASWMDGLIDMLRQRMGSWPLFFRFSLQFLARERPPAPPPGLVDSRQAAKSPPPQQQQGGWRRHVSNLSEAGGSDCPASPSTCSTFSASFALEGAAQPPSAVVLPIIMLRFVTPQIVLHNSTAEPTSSQQGDEAETEAQHELFGQSRRRLTFLGKVLQKVANGQRFDGPHEVHMSPINAFTTRSLDHMLEFAQELASPQLPEELAGLNIYSLRHPAAAAPDVALHVDSPCDDAALAALQQAWAEPHGEHDLVSVLGTTDVLFCAIAREMNSRMPLLASVNHHILLRATRLAERRLVGVGKFRAAAAPSGLDESPGSMSRSASGAILSGLLNAVRRKSFTTANSVDAVTAVRAMVTFACRRILKVGEAVLFGYSNHFVSILGHSSTGETIICVHGDLVARSWELFAERSAAYAVLLRRSLPGFTGHVQEADIQSYLLFWLEIAVASSAAENKQFQVVFQCPQDGDGRCPLGPNWFHNWLCALPEEWSSRCSQLVIVKPKETGLFQSLLLKGMPTTASGKQRLPSVAVADSTTQLGQLCQLPPLASSHGGSQLVVPCSIIAASQFRQRQQNAQLASKWWSLPSMREVMTFLLRICDGDRSENIAGLTDGELSYVRESVLGAFWHHPTLVCKAGAQPVKSNADSTSPPQNRERGTESPPGRQQEQTQLDQPPAVDLPSAAGDPITPPFALVSVSNLLHYPSEVAKSEPERRTFEVVVNEVLREGGGSRPAATDGGPVSLLPVVSLMHCPARTVMALLLTSISKCFGACLGDGNQRNARTWSLLQKVFYNITFAPPLPNGDELHGRGGRVHTALGHVLADTGTLTIGQKLEIGTIGIVANLSMLVRELARVSVKGGDNTTVQARQTDEDLSKSVEHKLRELMFPAGVPPGTQKAAVDEVCSAIASSPESFLNYAHFFAGTTLPAASSQQPRVN